MFSAPNFVASIFTVICVFWARIILNNTKVPIVWWPTKWVCLSCIKKPYMGPFLLLPSPASPPYFFHMGKLRRSNYYLTNLFKSIASNYVSPRKTAGCVFKFWMLQLNLVKVHWFLNASKIEHCTFDGCVWSLIKTKRSKEQGLKQNTFIYSTHSTITM